MIFKKVYLILFWWDILLNFSLPNSDDDKDTPAIKRSDDKGVKYVDYLQLWLELLPRSLSN